MDKVCFGKDKEGNKLDGCRFIWTEDGIKLCGLLKKFVKEDEILDDCPVESIGPKTL